MSNTQNDSGRGRRWYDLEVDKEEAQRVADEFFKVSAVLSSIMPSRQRLAAKPDAKSIALRKEWERLTAPPPIDITNGMDWRAVGEELERWHKSMVHERCDCVWCRVYQRSRQGQREWRWVNAAAMAYLGEPEALSELLHPEERLSRFDRECLAVLLNAIFSGTIEEELRGVGRPRGLADRACANMALRFYKDWRALNDSHGISDWGHRDEMKDIACRAAIDRLRARMADTIEVDHPMKRQPDFEAVRQLLSRPKSRLTTKPRQNRPSILA